jgi:hypothetical protein
VSLKFSDISAAPIGHFHLEIFRKGKLIEVFDQKNLIVLNSKKIHAHLLGGDVTGYSVSQISYGSNPTAPVSGNTTITTPYTKALDGETYPVDGTASFAFSLGTGEANGLAISEFGLLTASGLLYARKTRTAPLNKDTDITLSGSWSIVF